MPNTRNKEYKTSHIGVVAWLKYNEVQPLEMILEGDTACWLFADSGRIQDLVHTYNDSRAVVNPKIYNRIFSNTKTDMFSVTRPKRDPG